MTTINESVSNWLTANVLTEALVTETLKEFRRRVSAKSKYDARKRPKLEAEADRIRGELDNLVKALAGSTERPEAIMRGIGDRQRRLGDLQALLIAVETPPVDINNELDQLMANAKRRLTDLRYLLERNGEEARKVIAAVFSGPITCTPIETAKGPRYRIEGEVSVGKMLTTDLENDANPGPRHHRLFTNVASPAGFEPALQP